ncbi:chemotaxis protein CheA [Tatumella morbirosei]|uniref:Chemotaxis protein CheA n=1 Tax=Tatumella morbirosei TaxID=642227 RepID=A0A0F5BUP2_9GAMM|nr:chemotaxis protein CheA [Tatumella morbirosei]KKA63572.1 chemotaxis protein CheA [Tatumella morbirosei]
MDISDFYQTFFDEADELLADMEQHLLALDPETPDAEQLNAIFRAAHSIKGGAATFGFTVLQETTHILENILDSARRDELSLNSAIINIFLETKDIMQEQLNAYKLSQQPDEESFRYICEMLRQIALEKDSGDDGADITTGETGPQHPVELPVTEIKGSTDKTVRLRLESLKNNEAELLLTELQNIGKVSGVVKHSDSLEANIAGVSEEDLLAVLCFVVNEQQVHFISPESDAGVAKESPDKSVDESSIKTARQPPPVMKASESGSIRVAVEKVDQLINLVGELVITQSMLQQHANTLEPGIHGDLLNSMSQLERNARDLQESVMSIRMMPMEYVFSRFPRLVRDLAAKLGKKVELTLQGSSTELDKSLIERIIDPLTHLVRNSLDHGVEPTKQRIEVGKSETGHLILSAEHRGGNICIEVTDDGAGLNHEKILAKARSSGIPLHENMSDDDIGLLIFAPGFSTAEQVTDVSGRGVGMDVVKRNIQQMGGHVEISSKQGQGTTIRILLPLTLAILDGMSVRVGNEVFILPLNAVMESLQPERKDLKALAGGERVLEVRGEYLPLVALSAVFEVENAHQDPTRGIAIILQTAGKRYALLVDQLIGQHQVVVKNLESNYRKVEGISAATIMGDGSVAFIVDIAVLQSFHRDKCLSAKTGNTYE